MGHKVTILADSISEIGDRITTFEATYPRIIHAEVMTHRVLSRCAASSRAIPVSKLIKAVEDNPYIPSHWGKNQKGMKADVELNASQKQRARGSWLRARDKAVASARELLSIGLHKQLTNRLLEPFQWYTAIITATEWDNLLNLRIHPDAHPDIQELARGMKEAMGSNYPSDLREGAYHLPLIRAEDIDECSLSTEELVKISCARCARVSYLTHDGVRDTSKDLELYDRLLAKGHLSPLEHAARPMSHLELIEYRTAYGRYSRTLTPTPPSSPFLGNLRGWVSHRKEIPGEANIMAHRKA